MTVKHRPLTGEKHIASYEVEADTMAEALAQAAILVVPHETNFELVRINHQFDVDVDKHYVYLSVFGS
jgi:hypothetical protein